MTPRNRRDYARELLERAAESMRSAEKTLAIEEFKVAASQSYYAMFHPASALLAARDIHRHRHGGVIAAFGEQFAREGEDWQRLHAVFKKAFGVRTDCDYKRAYRQSREGAEAAVERAREFLQAADERLKVELEKLG